MPEPMSDERLAELRELAEENKKLTWQHPSERGVVDAVDEIARLRVENKRLAVTLLMHCKECADAAIGTETGTSGHH